ncbi:MAG TPA: MarR family transcriptional regulator [Firmicutes bacterium]|nr:MarR family transcriptional regulator [Bacillota bacterium]
MSYSDEDLAALVHDVNHEFWHYVRSAFRHEEIPRVVLMLLRRIREHPGITLSELARSCGLAKSHVSRQIEAMAAQGWVEKRSDPGDQRLIRLYHTEHSTAHYSQIRRDAIRVVADVVASLPQEAREDLANGLLSLRDALKAAKAKSAGQSRSEENA